MNEYQLAVYFWSAVLAVAVSAPFAFLLVRSLAEKFGHHEADPDSEPSLPSIPSYPGY